MQYTVPYGIKVTHIGQWMQDKWHVRKNKKGYLKIHVAVNVKIKKILSMKVTDEHVLNDSKALPELDHDVIKKSDKQITIGKLIDDGGSYDGNKIWSCILFRNNLHFFQA